MTQGLAIALKAAAISLMTLAITPAFAAEGHQPERESWTFAGPFGHFDKGQLQRGFKVYKEVCSSCHALSLISFRNLAEEGGPGFSEAQARVIAQDYKVQDGPDDSGQMFERTAKLSDRFPSPFPNDEAARAANGGALPPDFSLLAKARSYESGFPWFILDALTQYQEQGPDYIHAIITGYRQPPAGVEGKPGLHYNVAFPGNWIAMPPPISDGQVEYTDGTPQTVDQYSRDVASFMMWAAEPHLEARKRIGFEAMVFLIGLALLLFFTKRRVWSNVEH